MDSYTTVFTTCSERAELERIAHSLVERELAACVQIDGPIRSVYRWEGAIETAEEWRCAVKTRACLYDRVERAIRELHPYETPEIVAVPMTGSAAYLDWIRACTTSS